MTDNENRLALSVNAAYANIPAEYHDFIDEIRLCAQVVVSEPSPFNELCRVRLDVADA